MLGKNIKDLVIVKMDEHTPYGPSTPLLAGDDANEIKPIESYINETLEQAANEMLLIAPIHLLQYKELDAIGTPSEEDKRIGTIALPDDFLRLHTLRMKGWIRPCHVVNHEGDPIYTLQFKRWTRGTKEKPVVIIDGRDKDSEKAWTLHYYSVDASETTHEVKTFKYVPRFDGEMDYERSIAELIALHCARKVYEVYGNTEQVGIMTNEINSVLENMRL